ncbi:hypothetical protein GGR58DRAFT_498085 [Xylaria digitata]|nr:hypothetical protein GGR58DRAFT_498085 [Xylaria digitata]
MAASRRDMSGVEPYETEELASELSGFYPSIISHEVIHGTFRASWSRNYNTKCTARRGSVVCNWNARGYQSDAPHPSYSRFQSARDNPPSNGYLTQDRARSTILGSTEGLRPESKGKGKAMPAEINDSYTKHVNHFLHAWLQTGQVGRATSVGINNSSTRSLNQVFRSLPRTGQFSKAVEEKWHRDLSPTSEMSSVSTYQSSIFDTSDADSSDFENTSTGGREDNNELGGDAWSQLSLQHSSEFRLPCEFFGYSGCNQVFEITAVDDWIEHIVSQHFGGNLPAQCSCWFCDDFIFHNCHDLKLNFEHRMWHIRNHMLKEGCTIHDIRPDFYLLGHLNRHGLISTEEYNYVLGFSEIPKPSHVRSFDFISPEAERHNELSKMVIVDQAKEDRRRRPHISRHKEKADRKRRRKKDTRKTHAPNSSLTREAEPRFEPPQLDFYEKNQTPIRIHNIAEESNTITDLHTLDSLSNPSAAMTGNKAQRITSRKNDPLSPLNSNPYSITSPGNDSLPPPPHANNTTRNSSSEQINKTENDIGKKPKIIYGPARTSSESKTSRLYTIPSTSTTSGLGSIPRKKERCGQPLYIDVHPEDRQMAIEYAQAASGSTRPVTVLGATASGTSSLQTSSSLFSLTTPSEAGISDTTKSEPVQVQSSSIFAPPVLAQGTKKYLLLCVNTGHYEIKLEHIDLTNIALDVSLFNLIREKYESMRGPLVKNIFMVPKTVEYVKFELVNRSRTGECVGNYQKNSIPSQMEVKNKEYTFSPCPPRIGTMPIQPHLFMHSFLNPGDHLGGLALLQLPKKVGRKLKCVKQPHDPFDIPYGWGVYIVEGLNTFLVSLLLIGFVALVTVIVFLWSALRGDVQGGTGIGQYGLAAMGTIVAIGTMLLEPLRSLSR